MKNHPIMAGAWLIATFGGIVYGGLMAGEAAQVKAESQAQGEVTERMQQAVFAGRAGRFADAAKMLRALQAEYPQSTSVALNLGIAYRGLRMYDEALVEFERVVKAKPEDWDAVAEVATLRLLKGEPDAAIALVQKIPAGEGQLDMRLKADPAWVDLPASPELLELRKKHGVTDRGDSSVRRLQEMERRRREFEAANPKTPTKPTKDSVP